MSGHARPRVTDRGASVSHTAIAEALTEQPGTWGMVNTYRAKYTADDVARRIKLATGSQEVYAPAGSFDARVSMADEGWLVEGCYVGADVPRETSEA